MNDEQIKHMVNRFLGWKLPEDFTPDAGISFKRDYNENTLWPSKHEPTGTNLLDAIQAKAMIRYMLEGLPEDDKEEALLAVLPEDLGAVEYIKHLESLAQERGAQVLALRGALDELVKMNEDWNAAVEKIIGRSPNWTDGYLDRSRAALTSTADAAESVKRGILEEAVKRFPQRPEGYDNYSVGYGTAINDCRSAILGAGDTAAKDAAHQKEEGEP